MLDKSQLSQPINDNTSAQEIARFNQMAREWWDPNGKFKTALAFNATRAAYMIQHLAYCHNRDPNSEHCLQGLTVLDVGCGGGLISEALARKGADVTGIDASAVSIEVAKAHAVQSGLNIRYSHHLAEQEVQAGNKYDIVINAEVVEHVPDQLALIGQCAQLVSPKGTLVLATLNRTWLSWLIAIVGAEYVMRYLPVGTHDWKQFVKPAELASWVKPEKFEAVYETGMKLNPLSGQWRLSSSLKVNYIQLYKRHFID